MKKLVVFLMVAGLVLSIGGVAKANQFMNITFDSDTIGSSPATGSSGSPITTVQGIGGYDSNPLPAGDPGYNSPPNATSGTIIVNNVAGMNKAAVMTTVSSNGEMGALWMDTGFSQSSSQLTLKFDLSVLTSPAIATVQPKFLNNTTDQVGILFGINVFGSFGRGIMFAAAPTSETGGVFALRSADNTQLITFGSYTEGREYSLTLSADYGTGKVDAYINNILAMSDFPFWTSGTATPINTSEIFMFLNGQSGYANAVAIDNIKGYDTAIPEPATMMLLGLGLVGLAGIRRKFKG